MDNLFLSALHPWLCSASTDASDCLHSLWRGAKKFQISCFVCISASEKVIGHLNFSACAFLLPFRSYSMEPGPSLIQTSHIWGAEGGSDHIWTLLPALDEDFGSQNKGPHGAMSVQEKDTPKSTKVCNPAVQPQRLPSSHIFRYSSVLPNP